MARPSIVGNLAAVVIAACMTVPGWGQVHHVPPAADHPNIVVPQVLRRHWPGRTGPVELTAVGASVSITDQVATTTLELSLTNPGGGVQEAVVILPVPEGVAVRSLQYDGVGTEPKAEILPRDEARKIYESIVRSMRDPALVEFVGYGLIRTSAFPIPAGATQKLRLTYEQVLAQDGSRVDYVIPRSESLGGEGVAWTLTADISSKRPIASVYSASHDVVTERVSPTRVRVRMDRAPAGDRGALRLSYLLDPQAGALTATVFGYPDAAGGEKGGYFLLLASPPASAASERPRMKREVVIVLDRSGSMRGEKIRQAREAAIQVVRGLDDGESFNIIDYSDTIASFAARPVVKSAQTEKEAEAYIAGLQPNGGTNIHDALGEALRTPATEGTLPIVLFLTDGLPTVGERNEVKIRDGAKAANMQGRRIFTFGVGVDVNSPLLSALATGSRAASTVVLPQEDVEVKVSQVFRRLSGPVMASPRMEVVGGEARLLQELQPAVLPDVFDGDQLVVLGRYEGGGAVRVRVTGMLGGKETGFETVIDPAAASYRNGFVPRLWATRKVAALVDEIRQAGAEGLSTSDPRVKELVDAVVDLSTRYGILTEYTAFLAREDVPPMAMPEIRARVTDNLRDRAAGERTGAGGASQQLDLSAKSAAANAPAAGGYVVLSQTGQREERRAENIRQVADQTFYNRSNRWVDAALIDKDTLEPEETVEFGSEAYFMLAGELAKEGRQGVLAQGGEVYLVHKNRRVLVQAPPTP